MGFGVWDVESEVVWGCKCSINGGVRVMMPPSCFLSCPFVRSALLLYNVELCLISGGRFRPQTAGPKSLGTSTNRNKDRYKSIIRSLGQNWANFIAALQKGIPTFEGCGGGKHAPATNRNFVMKPAMKC